MGMFGPGKEGWLAEAEMLSWAFRHLKGEERDYLTKRLKHVLGKRTLKGSWFEKDKSLLEMLVAGPAHRAGLGSLPLMTAANTEKMHALDYPGLSEDKTPEAFFRRVEAAATHEKSKEAMRAFHEEIDGTPYDRRAFAMLIIYICGFGLSWYAKAFLERYCREFGANSQTTLSISFDPSLYEGKDGDPEGEEASAGEKSEKPSQEQAPAEAVPAGASETEGAREAPAQTGDEVPGVEAAKVAESAAEPAPVVPAPVVPVPAEGAKASTVFPRDFSVTVPPLPRGVTRYLGYIRTSGGNFFNFYVLAEWYKDRFGALESEAKQLFPSYGAFNLKSAGRNQIKEGAFYVIDLYPSDLMQNFDENGRVRSDFCKFVDFSRITSSKRFFSASCLLDAKKDVIEQLLKLDGMLEKRRENYRRLENLHTKLLEESKRICERTHGADGELMPESLVRALDAWTEDDDRSRRERLAQAVCGVRPAKLRGRELADALVRSVQEVRRYDENTVLNLYICWAQNFLTVLSGEPGSGKTSICHILARTLGLDAFDNLLSSDERAGLSAGRFVHVPVEYGWTSKRDFVGYWNPITNRFESSDPARWDLLRTLDAEERSASGSVYPAMMLLDEANLSPMEYYWSDWMRLCDEQTSSGIVTLWDKAPTKVPETLRFMATINNDSTTETLSPRLIDRAAVVTLPVVDCIENTSPAKVVGPVSWKELQAYFGVKAVSKNARELSDLHDRLMPMLEGFGIRLSPRSIRQMNGYVGAASSIFADGDKPAWLDAADFAVMQKCLPRITGTGAAYREKLVEFRSGLESLGLSRSVEVVDRILRQGDEAMDCYRFF